MVGFKKIELHKQWLNFDEENLTYEGIATPSAEALEKLITADTPRKLRDFAVDWFPFVSFRASFNHPVFEEDLAAVSDTRNLMILVLKLKRLAETKNCSKEAFESLGVTFGKGGTEKHEQASLHYLVESESLAKAIRNWNHVNHVEEGFIEHFASTDEDKEKMIELGYLDQDGNVFCDFACCSYAFGWLIKQEQLYLPDQMDAVKKLDDSKRYPVMNFFGGNLGKSISYSYERAMFFIDSIITTCIQGLRIETQDGLLSPKATTNFTSFWLLLSESFSTSRVAVCRCCGLPILATSERGTKRQYCNDSCKRKFKRALKYQKLITGNEMSEEEASKEAGIAINTAKRILTNDAIIAKD